MGTTGRAVGLYAPGSVELIGRATELALVEAALARAIGGRRTVLALSGGPGLGKSSLAHRLCDRAGDQGARVVAITATDAETAIGWSGLAMLVDQLRDLQECLPGVQQLVLQQATGRTGAAPTEPLAVAAATTDLFRLAVARQPLVLLVDDLHWLDRSSAGALSFAIRLLARSPVLVVAALRPEPLPLDLARVAGDDLVTVELAPLSVAGVRELLMQHGVELGRIDLVHVHQATGGNPMYVLETVRALRAGAQLGEALLPGSLAELVQAPLDELGPDHLRVLHAAALMPSPTMTRLARVEDVELVAAACTSAERADVVRVVGDALVFRHPLLRAALRGRMGELTARETHRRLAEVADDPVVRAVHLAEAFAAPEPWVAAELAAASDVARERGQLIEAASLALRSLDLTHDADPQRQRRLVDAADFAYDSGEPRRALQMLVPQLDDLTGDLHAEALAVVMASVAATEGSERAVPWARRWRDALPPGHPRRVVACATYARALMFADLDLASAAVTEAERSAQAGTEAERDEAFSTRLLADALRGEQLDLDLVRERLRAGGQVPRAFAEVAVWSDLLDVADAHFRCLVHEHERSGSVDQLLDALGQVVDIQMRLGLLSQARETIDRAAELAVAAEAMTSAALRLADRALLDALVGEGDTTVLDDLEQRAPELSGLDRMQLLAVCGLARLVRGDETGAVTALRDAHANARRIGYRDLGALPYHGNLVEALVAVGALGEADDVVREVRQTALRGGRVRGSAELARCEALLLAASHDLEGAAVAAERSLAAHASLTLPLERARVHLLAGTIARRRKQRTRSRSHLEEAVALLDACGASALASTARDELARVGGAADGVLTATEQRVAELAAAGRTNDEIAASLFISRRTVEANLTRIYRKLGIRSRTELAARPR